MQISIFPEIPNCSLVENSEFRKQLDEVSGCNLPDFLKDDICNLIESHTISSSLPVDINIAQIANLPENTKLFFMKLIDHVYRVDSNTKKMVLSILKVVSDAVDRQDNDHGCHEDHKSSVPSSSGIHVKGQNLNFCLYCFI